MQSRWKLLQRANLVAKDGVDDTADPALVDVNAAAGALVPKVLVLPWPGRCGKSKVAEPSHTLKGNEGLAHKTCTHSQHESLQSDVPQIQR